MKLSLAIVCALFTTLCTTSVDAQQPPTGAQRRTVPVGPVQNDKFRATYVRLGSNDDEGLLYDPVSAGRNARVAVLYSHPDGNNFNVMVGPELASRGFRVLMVNYRGDDEGPPAFAASISRGIAYLRTLPMVQRVIIAGHSGGGHLIAFYANVAEHGPAACAGPEKLYPCKPELVTGLAKPDGVVLLDPTLGSFHTMSAIDPAVGGTTRVAALDMFSAANGFDVTGKRAVYAPDFSTRFYAAQSNRNNLIIASALQRLQLIEEGKGQYKDDEPLVIPGMGVLATGARLYQPDVQFLAHTHKPRTLLKADGTTSEQVVASVRAATGTQAVSAIGTLGGMTQNTTVRKFLATSAIRTKPEFAMTADDIVGVDWTSSMNSTVGNAEGISVPTLVLPMSCHYLLVPAEIVYEHLAARDKTLAVVEGAVHNFTPCRPEFGDTVKRTFDFVAGWLAKDGRF